MPHASFQAHDLLMVDEVNDVRIIGVITICLLLGVAIIGMEWEARVRVYTWVGPSICLPTGRPVHLTTVHSRVLGPFGLLVEGVSWRHLLILENHYVPSFNVTTLVFVLMSKS